jgi:hypothetical protein
MNDFCIKNSLLLFALICTSMQVVRAEQHTEVLVAPDFDRWMYPFNGSIGDREVGSTFSSIGGNYEIFDDRDAQVLLSFITPEEIPVGIGAHRYEIVEATLYISTSNDGNIYDPTIDSWQTYLLEDGVEDEDAGRPVELFGAGFRGGFNGWTFGETGPFPFGASRGERNAYPIRVENGIQIDVSNNVLDGFEPHSFAVGFNDWLTPGQVMPNETVLSFSIDVNNPDIQCYLRNSFNEGLLSFMVSSLHDAQQPGIRGLIQPNFHMKESWAVYFGLADPAQLSFTVLVDDATTAPEDIDGDGMVGIGDLLIILESWGFCPCCSSDISGDGEVNVSDLLALIALWNT